MDASHMAFSVGDVVRVRILLTGCRVPGCIHGQHGRVTEINERLGAAYRVESLDREWSGVFSAEDLERTDAA